MSQLSLEEEEGHDTQSNANQTPQEGAQEDEEEEDVDDAEENKEIGKIAFLMIEFRFTIKWYNYFNGIKTTWNNFFSIRSDSRAGLLRKCRCRNQ